MPRTGGSFRGLVTYLLSSQGKTERVGEVRLTNCVSHDPVSAMLEVENTQARNGRVRHSTYHLILSFRTGEQPSRAVLEAVEQQACAALGFADHQRVSVVHHDTDHLHVHVAINRISPTTFKSHWPSYSKLALDRVCIELERDYGLQLDRHRTREREPQLKASEELRAFAQRECVEPLRQARSWQELHAVAAHHGVRMQLRGNGLALVDAQGETVKGSAVSRELSKAALERRLGVFQSGTYPTPEGAEVRRSSEPPTARRPPDMERIADMESLIGWIQRGCAGRLRAARTWAELHRVAGDHGLRVQLHGNGLVFKAVDGPTVKGSSIGRDLSKGALEQRLGPFQSATTAADTPQTRYRQRPMSHRSTALLYERYRAERVSIRERRDSAIARLREQRDRSQERLRRVSERRWAAIRLVAKGQVGWMLWSAYARRADRRDRERLRSRHQAAMRAVWSEHGRAGWLPWLQDAARKGDRDALLALRERSVPRPASSDAAPLSRYQREARVWASAGSNDRLRDLSAIPVVRFGTPAQVTLPRDTHTNPERPRHSTHLGVPRDAPEPRAKEPAIRRGSRRRR